MPGETMSVMVEAGRGSFACTTDASGTGRPSITMVVRDGMKKPIQCLWQRSASGTSICDEDATLRGDTYFSIGAFEAPDRLVLESHGNVSEMLGRLHIEDELPRHPL